MLRPSSSPPRGPLHRPPRRLAQSGVRSGAQAARDDVPGDAKLAEKVARNEVSCGAEAERRKAASSSSACLRQPFEGFTSAHWATPDGPKWPVVFERCALFLSGRYSASYALSFINSNNCFTSDSRSFFSHGL